MVEVEPAALLERHVRQIAVVRVLVEQRDGMSGQALHQPPGHGGLPAGGPSGDADGQGAQGAYHASHIGRAMKSAAPLNTPGKACAGRSPWARMRASMATDSPELSRIAAEALDIAKSAGQAPTTAHLLLATFTVPGAADVLLRERGCDEDKVLAELAAAGSAPQEPADFFAQALDRARQL